MKETMKKQRDNGGYTLVEVMIATLVLSISFMAMFAAIRQGYKMIETARDQTRASQILQAEMEYLRTLTFTQIENLASTAYVSTYYPTDAAMSATFGNRYQVTRYLLNLRSIYGHSDRADQYWVFIRVRWEDSVGFQDRYFYSMFTDGGLNDYYYRNLGG